MSTARVIFLSIERADGLLARARGLLWRQPLPHGCGLLLPATRVVHGFGMTRRLDLLFLGAADEVLDIKSLPPNRVRACRRARAVVELEDGEVARQDIRRGDRIRAVEADGPRGIRRGHARGRGSPGQCFAVATRDRAMRAAVRAVGRMKGSALIRALAPATALGTALGISLAPATVARAAEPSLPPAWIDRFADRAESLYRAGADEEAMAAFATLLHVDPGKAAVVSLRTGNLHQRNGRDWQAIESYRRALEIDPASADAGQREARRKALGNLAGLLDVLSRRVADVLQQSDAPPALAAPPQHPTPSALPAGQSSLTMPRIPSAPSALSIPSIPSMPSTPSPASRDERLPPGGQRAAATSGGSPIGSGPSSNRGWTEERAMPARGESALPRVEYVGGR